MSKHSFNPNRIIDYFYSEWKILAAVTISGLIYNIGLLANPWFEGQLAGCLVNILSQDSSYTTMVHLVFWYLSVITLVQIARYLKRFYVRRFANNVNRRMKKILYHNFVHKSKSELEQEGIGNVIVKAISDVDDCVEGMRKFTTELFDTGVALFCYVGMLLWYDWRLALLCLIFPPISYFIAEKMKYIVQKNGARFKEDAGTLSRDTLDRVSNAMTYRIFGSEPVRNAAYEKQLSIYEKSAVKANIWVSALPPLYQVICMISVIFILFWGNKNISGQGWCHWNIAAFTTFLSCYTKLSVKSSKAAKLFNSVHKAQVSWKRIKPFMVNAEPKQSQHVVSAKPITIEHLNFAYPGCAPIISNLNFHATPGQIIGVTGPVACGKSTLGRLFLCESPYQGSIFFGNQELSSLSRTERNSIIGYLGHEPELLNDTIYNNIFLGTTGELDPILDAVCMKEEILDMEHGIHTLAGPDGSRLSGGQAKRIALARTLFHNKPVVILDDPFSALDKKTENLVFHNLKSLTQHSIVILISHRLYLFPLLDQIIWMEHGETIIGKHEILVQQIPLYAELYDSQKGADSYEAK